MLALSTLKAMMSPEVSEVVQPVNVESCAFTALEIVGGAEAVILLLTVGGKDE